MSRIKDYYHEEIAMMQPDPGDPGNGPFDDMLTDEVRIIEDADGGGFDDWIANREADRYDLLEEINRETKDPEQALAPGQTDKWKERGLALGIDNIWSELSSHRSVKEQQKRIQEQYGDDFPF